MQTQCPHCDTKFRVTETQVSIADGIVRCGVCKETFNAYEVSGQDDHQAPLLDDDLPHEIETITATPLDEAPEADQEDSNPVFEGQPVEVQAIEDQTAGETAHFNEASTTDESRKDAFDFFDEDINDTLQYVVPDELRNSYTSRSQLFTSSVLWSTGILLLIVSLFIEYAWFNRHQLNQVPELQVWIEKLCQRVDCNDASIRDPSKIEMVNRNIYSHPNESNALMVNVTMKNNADYAQPYPVMQIVFSDIRGGNVAARRFLPTEYLQINAELLPLIQPEASISLTLEIQDPGKQAKTYEFNFL